MVVDDKIRRCSCYYCKYGFFQSGIDESMTMVMIMMIMRWRWTMITIGFEHNSPTNVWVQKHTHAHTYTQKSANGEKMKRVVSEWMNEIEKVSESLVENRLRRLGLMPSRTGYVVASGDDDAVVRRGKSRKGDGYKRIGTATPSGK